MQIEKENDTIFYKYDNQGNTLEEKSGKGTKSYVYDLYNRVREITTETGDYIKNSYTPLGLRYKKEVNGVVSRYIVDDWNIIAEVDKENNIKSREVRGYELLKKEVENKDYFYHTNEHGDIVYLTNEKENIENSYSYDVFGNIKEQKEAISNQFKYTGEQYDSEVQQYYLRARFYNPTIGRFTQEDVYRDDGLNLYVYVINNPLLWADPSGYAKCSQNKDVQIQEVSRTNWGPEHGRGNIKHNNAIETELDRAYSDGATDIRKNKIQKRADGSSANGSRIRPDASYVINGVRYNTNYVSNYRLNNNRELNRELKAFKKMYEADTNAVNRLVFQYDD